MTPAEFRHWLQGFRDAGGTDIDVILAKAQEIEAEVKLIPSGPAHPLPITPWYPQPWNPYTAPNTGDLSPWRNGEIFCHDGPPLPVRFSQ